MRASTSRRQFLASVGKGTLAATIGPAMATEIGLAPAAKGADLPSTRLSFGDLEPLAALMQETPVASLQVELAKRLGSGVPLKRLLAAAALANARSFGGEDYVGFHTMMALGPALKMAKLMPDGQAALPVFKVLYRNTSRIQDHGGRASEVLHPVSPGTAPTASPAQLVAAVRQRDTAGAEQMLARMAMENPARAFDALLDVVKENTEVHRTVLPYRAWELLDVVGHEHASTMLRQSLRYCLNAEAHRRPEWDEHGKILVRLLDEHHLMEREPGNRPAEDASVEELANTIFNGSPDEAAGAVASALAEGFDPGAVGEALSLAANQIVLRDLGRKPEWESQGKPAGSVHGDSIGVHASDSIHAWRNLSRTGSGPNVFSCLILAAWQVARDRSSSGTLADRTPLPASHHLQKLENITDPTELTSKLEDAIHHNLQSHATAAVQRFAHLGLAPEPVFKCLLRYAVSEDGALHAEKYFQTVWDDFHTTRPAFRWRHLLGLTRVTASEFGHPAQGQHEAREILAAHS